MKTLRRNAAALGLFVVFVLPFLVILYLLLSEIGREIGFAERERIGLEYIKSVRGLVQRFQQHRTAATADAPDLAAIQKAASAANEAVAQTSAIDRRLGHELRTSTRWSKLENYWRDLERTTANGAQDSAGHDALIAEAISFALHVGDTSNLILDPDLDSYYCMDAVVMKLLPITERLEQTRSLGLAALARQSVNADQRTALTSRLSAVRDARADLDRGFDVAFQNNKHLRAAIPAQPAAKSTWQDFLDLSQKGLIEAATPNISPADFTAANERAVVATYKLFDETAANLDRLLTERIAGFKRKSHWVEAFALIALATAAYVFWSFAHGQIARRRTEEELSSSELRKGAILESALDCIITMDLDGKVTEFNPAAERTFGYRRAEAIGQELGALIVPPALREMHRRGLAKFRETGEGAVLGKRIEINAMHADGHEFMVELAITPVKIGESTMFTAYIRDITERLRAAEDLRTAKESAEAANLAKSGFLANMSHEIRTPMNGILGMTELALNTSLTPSQREYLAMVKNSAESLLALLNDLLDFSKIEAGKLELERVTFDLRDTLGDTMQTLATRASEKGLELALHVRPDVPDALLGDPFRLRQVVVNLVGNALKFTDRGEITVRVESDGGRDNTALLRFAVTDTGIGIPEEARARIFSAFEQGDASTTRRFGGTGLGLAIASRIVDLMGGKVEVESEVGRGSTFKFTARFGVQKERGTLGQLPELEDLRVLAVDDNATNRMILRELFASWGMDVVVADGAHAALTELQIAQRDDHPFVIVVTDLLMPEMDGFGLIERMKEDPVLRDTRIIVLTSTGRAEDAQRCLALGVKAHLNKPFKHSLLLDTMLETLGSHRRHTAAPAPKIPAQRPLHILLAEDNAVNQRLAVVNLESWGHRVTVANDGDAAVKAMTNEQFDLVLMDCQMPRMGGFEATAAIRQNEQESGRHVPIIAMTANVMKGFREECLAAGMDGYVAKPIRRQELVNVMAAAIPDLFVDGEAPVVESDAMPTTKPLESALFDARALLEGVGGDRDLARELVMLCCEVDGPRLRSELSAALQKNDFAQIEQTAHGLKGLVGEFHASACYDAARAVEETARSRDQKVIEARATELERELQNLFVALQAFVHDGPNEKTTELAAGPP